MLERMADGLALTARALEQDDEELADQAIAALRELPDDADRAARNAPCQRPGRSPHSASGARTERSWCARTRTPTTSTCSRAAA